MSNLLQDPCCVIGLGGVGVYLVGWSAWMIGRRVKRWWFARTRVKLPAAFPERAP